MNKLNKSDLFKKLLFYGILLNIGKLSNIYGIVLNYGETWLHEEAKNSPWYLEAMQKLSSGLLLREYVN